MTDLTKLKVEFGTNLITKKGYNHPVVTVFSNGILVVGNAYELYNFTSIDTAKVFITHVFNDIKGCGMTTAVYNRLCDAELQLEQLNKLLDTQ